MKPYIFLLICLNNSAIWSMDNKQEEQLTKNADNEYEDKYEDEKYEIELMAFLFALYIICAPDSLSIADH